MLSVNTTPTGILIAHYDYGFGLLSQTNSLGITDYYTFDAIGSSCEMTTAFDQLANRYMYSPFGTIIRGSETVANNFKYVGEWGVTDDGNNINNMRAKYYMPSTAKFQSADPIGINGNDFNLYSYSGNQPTSFSDPSGFKSFMERFGDFANSKPGRIIKGGIDLLGQIEGFPIGSPHSAPDDVPPEFDDNGGQPGKDPNQPRWTLPGEAPPDNKGPVNDQNGHDKGYQPKQPPTARSHPIDIQGIKIPSNSWLLGIGALIAAILSQLGILPILAFADQGSSGNVASKDPNAKIGSSGYGNAGFISGDGTLEYQISYENDKTATGPAQQVVVTDRLNSNLNWSSLELSEIGFGDQFVLIPPGTQHYETTVPVSDNGHNFDVQVLVDLDLATGKLTASFYSIDSNTGLPPAINIGFFAP